MLTSLIDIAKAERIHSEDVSTLLESMFLAAGLEGKQRLGHEDFSRLVKELAAEQVRV